MKVALFVYSLGAGGAERQVGILARRLVERRYEVELFLVHDTIFYELPENIKVTVLDDAPLFVHPLKKLLRLVPLARKYAKLCDADISISFMNRPNYINVLSKFFGNKARIVVAERGAPRFHFKGIEGAVSKVLIRHLYPRADLVVANSRGSAKDLQEHFGIANVITIPNAFDLDAIRELAKEPIPEKRERFTFITVGRLDRGKNHRLLIEALAKSGLDADLWIIGEGPQRANLEKLIAKLGLQERVKLLGRQTNPFAYLAKADCFVFSSTNEGFPNVLVEAMACGLPVISTDCPFGPAEILENGKYGILVPNGDMEAMSKAMRKIATEAILRKNLAKNATIRAKDFARQKILNRWIKVIDEKKFS